mgnify:CR=1 FL=1
MIFLTNCFFSGKSKWTSEININYYNDHYTYLSSWFLFMPKKCRIQFQNHCVVSILDAHIMRFRIPFIFSRLGQSKFKKFIRIGKIVWPTNPNENGWHARKKQRNKKRWFFYKMNMFIPDVDLDFIFFVMIMIIIVRFVDL